MFAMASKARRDAGLQAAIANDAINKGIQAAGDANGQLDWSVHFMDGTVIRAHQHAAGAKGGTLRRRRSGAARAVSARKCICGRKAAASR